MRDFSGSLLFSATDLMRFMGCLHATALDLALLRGAKLKPQGADEDSRLLQQKGDAHEAAHLEKLRAAGRRIVEIARGKLERNAEETRAALASGAAVVYQGAFLSGSWGGWSDFLERIARPSGLGDFGYEIADTKLKRSAHPKHALQLVLYSDLLAEIQGAAPEFAHVELGDFSRATLRLNHYAAYVRLARARLEGFVADPQPTRPIPCAECALCRWAEHCDAQWMAEDSLFAVANISKTQIKRLEAAGIRTLEELAAQEGPLRGFAPGMLDRLRAQARLQQARKTGEPHHELRPPQPGKGFDLLPQPQDGDLFYDIEGDPHVEGGLEYLHGVWTGGEFRAFWAHDHQAEKQALEELFAFFRERLEEHPQARIYHYAPYETTALKRLAVKYGVGEAFLDRLLRERRFVDLYAVTRGALIASEPNYSIKSLEALTGFVRKGEVKTAGGSVVAYEAWRETKDQAILDDIEDYNRQDCVSTEKLRVWLTSIRPEGPWPNPGESAAEKEVEEDAEAEALRASLQASDLTPELQEACFNLGCFHKRELKPAWWAIFDSLGKEDEDLIEDFNALGGLEALGPATPVKRSMERLYRFPPQETKLREGESASAPAAEGGLASVSIATLDRGKREIMLKIGVAKADVLTERLTLHPAAPLKTDAIAEALKDVIADQCGPRRYKAVDDLLTRRLPRLTGEGPILQGEDLATGVTAATLRMDETLLAIQGPPGTGKTYVTARAILALVAAGKRVGVSSNSHEAIRNLLLGCVRAHEEAGKPFPLDLVHKTGSEDGYPEGYPIRRTDDNKTAAAGRQIVGGTAFFFARDENIQEFDWLVVDEAGQVSLANLAAMGRAARNLLLVGDPQQLPQVIQGAHPAPANLSCFEWILGEAATMPPERGIFLDVSRRMHPGVCGYVSEQFYEGRLTNHPSTARRAVKGTSFPETGVFWAPVAHEGNEQTAREEAQAIREAAESLLAGSWTDLDGSSRPMTEEDLIVVAPYNAQVNLLREILPKGIRVGTVDKFQGQEAPVCLISLTASSAEETPRGLEFLLSPNRINVAVSRAKALALIFGSPRLREAPCDSLEQMRMVNAICVPPSLAQGPQTL